LTLQYLPHAAGRELLNAPIDRLHDRASQNDLVPFSDHRLRQLGTSEEYRVDGIFRRVGRIASNDVIIQLVKSKCFPVLFYGLEACSLRKYQCKSINYVINSTFRKLFNTRSQETVDVRLEMFGCLQSERTIAIRKRKFLNTFCVIHNALCRVFVAIAKTELESCCTDV